MHSHAVVVVVVDAVQQDGSWFVRLLGGFELHGPEGLVDATPSVQRLVAYIALQGGSVARSRVARELWPEASLDQGAANLRSALWRTRRTGPLVRPGSSVLRLGPQVGVDVHRLWEGPVGSAAAGGPAAGGDGAAGGAGVAPASRFDLELLPEWADDWVTVERERLRLLELQQLDDQMTTLVARGRVAEALDTALRAIRLEPLRESSHQAVIRIFLEAGNRSAALSHYHGFVALLRDELGLGPDPRTTALVQAYLPPRRHASRSYPRRPVPRKPPRSPGLR